MPQANQEDTNGNHRQKYDPTDTRMRASAQLKVEGEWTCEAFSMSCSEEGSSKKPWSADNFKPYLTL
jgi:hypothetical protein